MANFVPTKLHIREILLFHFNSKINATKSQRLFKEAYGEHAPSSATCRQWFRRFKTGDFSLVDKERLGQPKKFSDEKLKLLLKDNPTETIDNLAKLLNVDRSTVGKRLLNMGMVRQAGSWQQIKSNGKNLSQQTKEKSKLLKKQNHQRIN